LKLNSSAVIACTLSPDDMPRRAAEIGALGRETLLAVERSEARATLRFRRDPATRARVERIVALESECCAFIDFELSDTGNALVLTLQTPNGGEPALHMLVDLFSADEGLP
jgi:hypothetical protein